MDVNSIALSGLRAATTDLKTVATNIANQDTPGFKAQKVDKKSDANGGVQVDVKQTDQDVDTADQLVKGDIATYTYQANLKVLKTQKEMDKSLLDLQA